MLVPYETGGVHLLRRDGMPQDLEVCDEVVRDDSYRLASLLPRVREVNQGRLRILDLGAHIGAFSSLAQVMSPDADIHAYEMHPGNEDLLKQNVGDFATVTMAAITSWSPGSFIMADALPSGSSGGSFIVNPADLRDVDQYRPTPYEGQVLSLDDIFARIGHCDIVKMDIEAQEVSVFERLSALDQFTVIVGEMHRASELLPLLYDLPHHRVELSRVEGDTDFGYFRVWNEGLL